MVNLITEHMNIWTSAQTQKANAGRGRRNNSNGQSPHGIKKLRELILELAVRGKLVPQDPNDGPASVLLVKIAKEKARLIKEGKIKKQKPLPEITEEEKPFNLPEGWEWTRLGDVIEFVNGFAFKSNDFSDTGVGIVKIGDIQNGEITTASMSRVDEAVVAVLDDSLRVSKGEMLIAMSGATTGKLGFNTTNEVFYINQRVGKILSYCLYIKYLFYPLTTKIAENLAKSMGSAIPNLSTAQIKNIVFALPPLAEQHHIVAKVDELMAFCYQLEQQQTESNGTHQTLVETILTTLTTAYNQGEFAQAWLRIAKHFGTLFTTEYSIDQLKQTVLQLAVMGKLVPQDPTDEPASVLLAKITKEKARLIKEGKIKKQKPLPEIAKGEQPFELPETWMWVPWGDILAIDDAAFKRGPFGSSLKKDMFVSNGYKVYEQYCPINDDCSFERYYITEEKFESMKVFAVKANDYLVSCSGVTLGRITQVPEEFKEGIINQALLRVRINHQYVDKTFFKLFFRSPYFQELIFDNSTGSAIPNVKGVKKLKVMPVALLPISEQRQIVAKVDELMALCDTLKARLNDAHTTQVQLADSIVEQAMM